MTEDKGNDWDIRKLVHVEVSWKVYYLYYSLDGTLVHHRVPSM